MSRKVLISIIITLGCIIVAFPILKEALSSSDAKPELIFDKEKWETHEKANYPYREMMLKDLMDNRKLKTLSKNEIIEMLGEPDRMVSEYLYYTIHQTRFILFPLHTKTLVIKLSSDSTANKVMIHE